MLIISLILKVIIPLLLFSLYKIMLGTLFNLFIAYFFKFATHKKKNYEQSKTIDFNTIYCADD